MASAPWRSRAPAAKRRMACWAQIQRPRSATALRLGLGLQSRSKSVACCRHRMCLCRHGIRACFQMQEKAVQTTRQHALVHPLPPRPLPHQQAAPVQYGRHQMQSLQPTCRRQVWIVGQSRVSTPDGQAWLLLFLSVRNMYSSLVKTKAARLTARTRCPG